MNKFVCPKCGNSSEQFIGYKNNLPYCRACISFQGKEANKDFLPKDNLKLELKYPLSEKQENISNLVVKNISEGKNILIHAITGAGKTELVYKIIELKLQKRLHVGFATPRKDVVVDLLPRFKEAFPKADIKSVYGEHSSQLNGDIILLTTHQLYRYNKYFDLLVLDEIDAFPYKGNQVLNHFFYQSIKGNYILLSATPSKEDIENIKKDNGVVLNLFERYHHHLLDVPLFIKTSYPFSYYKVLTLLNNFIRENKQVFIFVPTIDCGVKLFSFLNKFNHTGAFVSSKEESRRLDIEKFKNQEYMFLVTTSILERGVTVKDLQVIVFESDHDIYNAATLIQISGRVGRKINAPTGKIIFLGKEKNQEIEKAIHEIERYNSKANIL